MERLDHIVVPLSELLEQLELMRDDGMAFVDLLLSPSYEEDGEVFPARIDLSAMEELEAPALTDYDSVDAVTVD